MVEPGAGLGALIPDEQFTAAAAVLGDAWAADVVLTVTPPDAGQVRRLRRGAVLIGFLAPLTAPTTIDALRAAGVHGFAMEAVPRITRAQSMDVRRRRRPSPATRRCSSGRPSSELLPMLTTAAGTLAPSKVLVLAAGVAGLQAIATARRLGAVVAGFDVRPAAREQVLSLGATFVGPEVDSEGEGGYARTLTAEEQAKTQRRWPTAIPGTTC